MTSRVNLKAKDIHIGGRGDATVDGQPARFHLYRVAGTRGKMFMLELNYNEIHTAQAPGSVIADSLNEMNAVLDDD